MNSNSQSQIEKLPKVHIPMEYKSYEDIYSRSSIYNHIIKFVFNDIYGPIFEASEHGKEKVLFA